MRTAGCEPRPGEVTGEDGWEWLGCGACTPRSRAGAGAGGLLRWGAGAERTGSWRITGAGVLARVSPPPRLGVCADPRWLRWIGAEARTGERTLVARDGDERETAAWGRLGTLAETPPRAPRASELALR